MNDKAIVATSILTRRSLSHLTTIILKPFTQQCMKCNQKLIPTFKQSVTVYLFDRIRTGSIYNASCCDITYFPDSLKDDRQGTTMICVQSIYNQEYVYFSEKNCYHINVLIDFSTQFLSSYTGFRNYAECYNNRLKRLQQQKLQMYETIIQDEHPLDRRQLQRDWFIYECSLYSFFIKQLDYFIISSTLNDVHRLSCFGYTPQQYKCLRTSEKQSDDDQGCGQAFVTDGFQKSDRHICSNKNKFISTREFPELHFGCGRTPSRIPNRKANNGEQALYRDTCKGALLISDEMCKNSNDDESKGIFSGCNVRRIDRFVGKTRKTSSGIIYTYSPCGIVLAFDELFRSEQVFICLWHWFKLLDCVQQFYDGTLISKCFIYDNACSVYLYLHKNYGKLIKKTNASQFVFESELFIDKLHQKNHRRNMCENERNIRKHPKYAHLNTVVCEQTNSVIKQYQNKLSAYCGRRSSIIYLLLFHLLNCKRNGLAGGECSRQNARRRHSNDPQVPGKSGTPKRPRQQHNEDFENDPDVQQITGKKARRLQRSGVNQTYPSRAYNNLNSNFNSNQNFNKNGRQYNFNQIYSPRFQEQNENERSQQPSQISVSPQALSSIEIFIYFCNCTHHPTELNNVKLKPILPSKLPVQHAVILKYIDNHLSYEEVKMDIEEK
ncbi:unnamed protein product [Didymodactylos carnosus]|uniref:Uncharacterized protein n=1 Tax=Didymodactylos carnosus TaxID=1234261 RepID=A0A815H7Q3_9BILA|nr:unnamed protein product [Didymodactylos carnosus]CAF4215804.1 unnamed protein product [Didymodactylos carnosus]